MIRDILIHPDPRLKKLCEPIAKITPDIIQLAHDMLETMYDAPGVGLAAPQVGVTVRMFVMDCIKDGPPEPMVLINPEILWQSETPSEYEEGCLSIPDVYSPILRPESVQLAWTDLQGARCERAFSGLWATCAQHEIDHLNGRLFIDNLGPLKRQMITRKMEKLKRERARGA